MVSFGTLVESGRVSDGSGTAERRAVSAGERVVSVSVVSVPAVSLRAPVVSGRAAAAAESRRCVSVVSAGTCALSRTVRCARGRRSDGAREQYHAGQPRGATGTETQLALLRAISTNVPTGIPVGPLGM